MILLYNTFFFPNVCRNAAHTENAVHRRLMNHEPWPWTPPSPKPATPTETFPPPTMTSPAPTPSEPFGTSPAPDGSASPSISAPAPSNSGVPRVAVESYRSKKHQGPIIAGAVGGTLVILVSIISIYICKINKVSVNPWATGLSGQLQKAFVTGMSLFLVK